MTSVRDEYGVSQAAQQGDRSAFDRIWQGAETALTATARRALSQGDEAPSPDLIREVMAMARDRSFEELPDKPIDWSTYGWLSWITRREALTARPSLRMYELVGLHPRRYTSAGIVSVVPPSSSPDVTCNA